MNTREPLRLIESEQLTTIEREALQAGCQPAAYDAAAGLARFRATLGGGGLGGGPSAPSATGGSVVGGAGATHEVGGALRWTLAHTSLAWKAGGLVAAVSLTAAAVIVAVAVDDGDAGTTPTAAVSTEAATAASRRDEDAATPSRPGLSDTLRVESLETGAPNRSASPARLDGDDARKRTEDAAGPAHPAFASRRGKRAWASGAAPESSRVVGAVSDTDTHGNDGATPRLHDPLGGTALEAATSEGALDGLLEDGLALSADAPGLPSPEQADELRAVARARRLLPVNPAGALSVLRQLDQRQPGGHLQEERMALEALALAGSGARSEAKAAAQRFVRTYPRSPYVDPVRRLLER